MNTEKENLVIKWKEWWQKGWIGYKNEELVAKSKSYGLKFLYERDGAHVEGLVTKKIVRKGKGSNKRVDGREEFLGAKQQVWSQITMFEEL